MNRQEQIELLKSEIAERRKMLKELQNTSTIFGRVEYENCGSYCNLFVKTFHEPSSFGKERRTRIATMRVDHNISVIDGLIKDLTELKENLSHADR